MRLYVTALPPDAVMATVRALRDALRVRDPRATLAAAVAVRNTLRDCGLALLADDLTPVEHAAARGILHAAGISTAMDPPSVPPNALRGSTPGPGIPENPEPLRTAHFSNEVEHRDRMESAIRRVRYAQADARYHEKQAQAARAKAALLIRTWELNPEDFAGDNP